MLLYTRLAPPKAPKRRSRAGCTFCKEKKKKCDEERPQCARCAERGLDCVYEPVRPRQRRKRDSMASSVASTATTASSRLGKPTMDEPSYASARRWSGDSPRSNSSSSESGGTVTGQLGQQEDYYYNWPGASEAAVLLEDDVCESDLFSPFAFDTASMASSSPYPLTANLPGSALAPIASLSFDWPPPQPEQQDDDEGATPTPTPEAATACSVVVSGGGSSSRTNNTPDLAMIAPIPASSPLLDFCPPLFSEFSPRPQRRALVDHFCNVLSHLIVFREESGNPFLQLVLPLSMASPPVLNAVYALASAHLEHRGVAAAPVDVLGIGDGGVDDGAEEVQAAGGQVSLYFHNRAIQGLARLIESGDAGGKVNRNELLAAIMLLVYYEVLVQKGRSNIVEGHLKGALTIMSSNPEPADPTGTFLERAFRFYDVIAALSFGTAPLSTAPAAGCFLPFAPPGARAASPLSSVDTLLGMATTLWPIIHRLSGLSSLKKELERAMSGGTDQTAASSTKVAVLRTEFETTAEAVEVALKQWRPCLPPGFSPEADDCDGSEAEIGQEPDPATPSSNSSSSSEGDDTPTPGNLRHHSCRRENARLQSIFNNAMAYRHSALVYLYREVHELARSHPAVQHHARLALRHCAATCSHAGPMSALLWPLFVAACDAVAREDREVARRAFAAIDRRQGMTNIRRAWDIVQEVWRRADLLDEQERREKELLLQQEENNRGRWGATGMGMRIGCALRRRLGGDLWRRVTEDMGVNIVFG
ncbi:C6 finger domain-containing protein [Pleurostoma richardsiae]|uniref:C6 finger domain-containing protein n=1 Tax=Pleurostoma richardsiae TaxID=41990 RepID=A0AA38S4Z2_9PEZI|nr:C6 finger domain-containing protein [Pleurostoma richardsiae]